jgi:predicted MFS family arabinose efflux permease
VRRLIRIRNARIYLLGDVVSTLGDSALWLALAIWVKELTGSSSRAGLVIFCYVIGGLAAPVGGIIADRFRRRPLLIWSNLTGAVVVLGILLVPGRSQLWIVYLVVLCYGMVGSVIGPAQTALLPSLVPEDLLAEANAAQQTLNQGLKLVTPLIGAGMFTLVGAGAVAEIDAGTFGVAILSLLALRVKESRSRRPEGSLPAGARGEGRAGSMTAGFAFIRGEPMLRALTIALAFALLAFGFIESAGFSVVTVGLHHAASFVGVLISVLGAGAVAGGLTAAPLLHRLSEGMLTMLALACLAAGVLLLTLPGLLPVLAGAAFTGFVGPWISVAAITALQRRTPTDLLGRVDGAFGLSLTIPQVTSVGLGAALIAIVSYRVLLVVIAAVAVIAATFLVSQPGARQRLAAARTPELAAGDAPDPDVA